MRVTRDFSFFNVFFAFLAVSRIDMQDKVMSM